MPCAVMYTCNAAWKGPQICSIQGELAPPLDPCRGLPQGDSTAPCALYRRLCHGCRRLKVMLSWATEARLLRTLAISTLTF
eukprot:1031517-Pyramimonas_sp.AAC.1